MKKHAFLPAIILAFIPCFVQQISAIDFNKATPVKLAGGMKFTEGPAWHPNGYLIFSDIDGNVIYSWSEKSGLDTLAYPAGNSNGLLYARKCPFLVCQQGARAISKMDEKGRITKMVDQFRGKKFNSPNDLLLDKKGNLYFTDPDFGFNAKSRELPFQGFYMLPSGKEEAILLDSTLNWPNGLTCSKDGKFIFLCESKTNIIYRYPCNKSGLVGQKTPFISVQGNGLIDGITTDNKGNLYVAFNRGGIQIFGPTGSKLGQIQFPAGEDVRNLCFGGKNNQTLYVTAGKSLYKIE